MKRQEACGVQVAGMASSISGGSWLGSRPSFRNQYSWHHVTVPLPLQRWDPDCPRSNGLEVLH